MNRAIAALGGVVALTTAFAWTAPPAERLEEVVFVDLVEVGPRPAFRLVERLADGSLRVTLLDADTRAVIGRQAQDPRALTELARRVRSGEEAAAATFRVPSCGTLDHRDVLAIGGEGPRTGFFLRRDAAAPAGLQRVARLD